MGLMDFHTGFDLARNPKIPRKWYTKVGLVLAATAELVACVSVLPRLPQAVGIALVVLSVLVAMYLIKVVLLSFVTKVKNV